MTSPGIGATRVDVFAEESDSPRDLGVQGMHRDDCQTVTTPRRDVHIERQSHTLESIH
jgi:hypothetical protein